MAFVVIGVDKQTGDAKFEVYRVRDRSGAEALAHRDGLLVGKIARVESRSVVLPVLLTACLGVAMSAVAFVAGRHFPGSVQAPERAATHLVSPGSGQSEPVPAFAEEPVPDLSGLLRCGEPYYGTVQLAYGGVRFCLILPVTSVATVPVIYYEAMVEYVDDRGFVVARERVWGGSFDRPLNPGDQGKAYSAEIPPFTFEPDPDWRIRVTLIRVETDKGIGIAPGAVIRPGVEPVDVEESNDVMIGDLKELMGQQR